MSEAIKRADSEIPMDGLPSQPWAIPVTKLCEQLTVDPEQGLGAAEVSRRQGQFGRNELASIRPKRVTAILLDQFRSIIMLLLCLAAAIAFLFGDHIEALAVVVVIIINSAIGFLTEWRATRSMEALRQLGHFDTTVRRDGKICRIPAAELVPGDITFIEGGDVISADTRLIETAGLQADESTLTGESLPVDKQRDPLSPETALIECSNMLFKGTSICRGSGLGIVIGTGQNTELGRIAQLVRESEAQETPLEKRLDSLGKRLVWVMLGFSILIAVAGVVAGRDTVLAIQVAVALMVAAIPEGLPIVATIALARGMWRMSKRNALIVRLSAVETLGATGVILTDKTGTLTENRMTVSTLILADHVIEVSGTGLELRGSFRENGREPKPEVMQLVDQLLEAVTLCSNASLQADSSGKASVVGDPTETALLMAAAKRGLLRESVLQLKPEVKEVPFDAESKAMATFHRLEDGIQVSVKGAAESLLPNCVAMRTTGGDVSLTPELRELLLQRTQQLGNRGLRTLAVATRTVSDASAPPYEALVLLGVTGLLDPARPGVREAIAQCHEAGIRVVMITGDHVATAQNIAVNVNLVEEDYRQIASIDAMQLDSRDNSSAAAMTDALIIARATPKQKLELISQYQQEGHVVAMTGDGVNDAPALKKADIGVAMGIRGTPVAKEAAAMILQDDQFATIVEAIAQGRAIYANIRKFVVYLLSCNISEVLVVGLATVAGAPLPLLPLQILFLNLVTDVFPALALGVGDGPPDLMKRKPRPAQEAILTNRHWIQIAFYGLVMSGSVLGAMSIAVFILGFSVGRAVSVSFCTLAFAQLWHVFNMRDVSAQWFNNDITRNPWVWSALVLCLLLILSAVYVPAFSTVLGLVSPGLSGWAVIALMSLVPVMCSPLIQGKEKTSPPAG